MYCSKFKKQEIIEGLINHKIRFSNISKEWRNDKDVALEAVKQNGLNLYFASERLKDDENVVLEAVKEDGLALEDASKRLRDNKDVVLEAIKNDGFSLSYASDRLQVDRDLLEIIEKSNLKAPSQYELIWYTERVEVLANIRDKELMENSINLNNKTVKKLKF